MNLEAVSRAAADNMWGAIWPELTLGCIALLLLVLETILPKNQHRVIPGVAALGVLATLIGLFFNWNAASVGTETFSGLLHHTSGGQIMRAFFLISALLVCLLGSVSLAKQRMPRVEFYHVMLVVTAAMMLLVQSSHFVMLFVALETLTIGLYILVGYFRTSVASLEAGLKYLIMGALSSGLLLFGIVLLYGVAGNPALPAHTAASLHYDDLSKFLAANPHQFLASLGIVLVLAGIAFKIAAFPFQIWVPDVYQGAPTPVTAFLAIASKAAGFAVLLGLCGANGAFAPYRGLTTPILSAMADPVRDGGGHDPVRQYRGFDAAQCEAIDRSVRRVARGLPAARGGRRVVTGPAGVRDRIRVLLPLRLPAGHVRGVRRDGSSCRARRRQPGTGPLHGTGEAESLPRHRARGWPRLACGHPATGRFHGQAARVYRGF
jgi:hypothetical protein